jgi:uncharacterized DUF497 family protein
VLPHKAIWAKFHVENGQEKPVRWSDSSNQDLVDNVPTMSYIRSMKTFRWNAEKNKHLFETRGISFDEIVQKIESGARYLETDHPNPQRYPNQKIIVVEIDAYMFLVPCVITGNEYFLKTIIPSRKATKKYLGGRHEKTD